jgi:hypothetical protein
MLSSFSEMRNLDERKFFYWIPDVLWSAIFRGKSQKKAAMHIGLEFQKSQHDRPGDSLSP